MLRTNSRFHLLRGRRLHSTTPKFPFPQSSKPTPYQIFHLQSNATQEDIKARYYELVRLYHPDRFRTDASVPPELAHSRFQAINAAYKTLQGNDPTTPDGKTSSSGEATSAAAWRAMHIYRRRKLYEGGDDRWKDGIIIVGVGCAIALFVAQNAMTRRQAIEEMLERKQHAAYRTRTSSSRGLEETENTRLAARSIPKSDAEIR